MSRSSLNGMGWALVAVGLVGSAAGAQVPEKKIKSDVSITAGTPTPEKRIKSNVSIPLKKEEELPTPPKAPVTSLVPGTKTEVILPPRMIVSDIVVTEAGPGTVIVERAPAASARALPWFPLLGLLGGAVLASSLDHGGADTTAVSPTPPTVPATTPTTPPTAPPTTPPTTPTTPPTTPTTPPTTPTTPPTTPPETPATPPVVPGTPPVIPPVAPPETPATPPLVPETPPEVPTVTPPVVPTTTVPEPMTMTLVASGLAGIALMRRRKTKG